MPTSLISMRYLAFLAVFAMLLGACGDGSESGDTSTSFETTTTSFPATTATTTPETTTTTAATTTTVAETTTTTELLDGDWAAEPLVVSAFGALGWWDGANWNQVDETTPLPVSGGEDYQVARYGVEAVVTGSEEMLLCEPLMNPGVDLSNTEVLGGFPGPSGLAISAPWTLSPHLVQEEEDTDGTYAGFARALLADRGMDVPEPEIKQVLRFDLEGDGVNEVIAVAEHVSDDQGLFAEEGDYSLMFMRRVVDDEVQTAILGESLVTDLGEGETPFILTHWVAAVADLSGDGKMEVITHEVYYEGEGWGVWEYVNDDLGPVRQISSGCGV